MKAVYCTKYGPPEVLEFREIEKPVPKPNEVLIKVIATTVHVGDTRIRRFDIPYNIVLRFIAKIILGWRKPRKPILGMELSGEIEEAGKEVKKFKMGDEIFASMGYGFGAYVEYKCMKESDLLALKPTNMSFEEAATVPNGAFTALCIIKQANIQPRQKVLIYGASGSVGTFSVQFAKNLRAEVTGVCSTGNLDMIKSLGADSVIDYTKEDFTKRGEIYDVVFDAVDKYSRTEAKKPLKEDGIYLNVDSSSNKCKFTPEALVELKDMIENNKLKTVIDRQYPFEDIIEAHRYVDQGHKKGNVVISIDQ